MADLLQFVNSALHSGQTVDVYLNRTPQIGDGATDIVASLHLKLHGRASILGRQFAGEVEIVMPDLSSSGTCRVVFNGQVADGCAYQTNGSQLKIRFPGAEITLMRGDKSWTWVGLDRPPVWIGIWPTSAGLVEEDLGGGPDLTGLE